MDRVVLEYNGLDVINTLDVYENILPHLDERYITTYQFTERLLEPLMYMMTRGVLVDVERLEKVKEETDKKIIVKQQALNELAGEELNPNSPKQLKEYFYIKKGIPPYTKRSSTGSTTITVDDKALQRIARGTSSRPGLPEAKLIQEIRALKKLSGTYLDLDLDKDKRFRCSYNPRGTKFGRLSSSKTIFGTGMNMQNLPYVFKQFLIADPNYLMFEIDKAKAEWVVVAYASGDQNMIRVIEEGLDPHIHTAHLMTDIDPEIIKEDEEAIGHLTDATEIARIRKELASKSPAIRKAFEEASFIPRTMSIRQCGKKSNHGLNYDEGYRTFALTNEMLEAEAKKIIHLYKHKAYPGIPKWHKSIQEKLRHDRTLVNCFGRTYKFLGAWDQDLFKAAYAFIPQSTVADLVNYGVSDSYYDTKFPMNLVELLGQVHDSILGQYPLGNPKSFQTFLMAARAMQRVAKYMNREMEYSGRTFYIDNDMKVGNVWAGLKEVNLNASEANLAKELEGVYNELRAGA